VTLVVDASMVVAGLTDSGADGRWAEAFLAGDPLATLDGRLANSPGPRCRFLPPPVAT
jgi:hypothetical protein